MATSDEPAALSGLRQARLVPVCRPGRFPCGRYLRADRKPLARRTRRLVACPTQRRPGLAALAAVRIMTGPGQPDFAKLAAEYRGALQPKALARLAASLGVSAESLGRLGVGWASEYRCWSFPMTDIDGHVLGIRLRRPDGRKLAVTCGHDGLFISEAVHSPHPDALPKGPMGEGSRLLTAEIGEGTRRR
jgi:hypothetical protein